jgi:hypothetical protein
MKTINLQNALEDMKGKLGVDYLVPFQESYNMDKEEIEMSEITDRISDFSNEVLTALSNITVDDSDYLQVAVFDLESDNAIYAILDAEEGTVLDNKVIVTEFK